MDIYGYLWISMDIYGYPRITVISKWSDPQMVCVVTACTVCSKTTSNPFSNSTTHMHLQEFCPKILEEISGINEKDACDAYENATPDFPAYPIFKTALLEVYASCLLGTFTKILNL